MKVNEIDEKDVYGQWAMFRIWGKNANPQKIHEELYRRYGGQGYKFAIVFDCSADEWEEQEKETLVYTLDCILDEVINYCGLKEIRRRLDELTCRN